jgi:hypothetical protein
MGAGGLAGSYTVGSSTTTYVPLRDLEGSTIALVNTAQPNQAPTITFTYDIFGNPTVNGATAWPFQYQGMEHEVTDPASLYFNNSGDVYNPQIQRTLSQLGQQSIDAASGSGFGQPQSSGGQQGNTLGQDFGDLAIVATAFISVPMGEFGTVFSVGLGASLSNFFDLFGGSDDTEIPRQLQHKRHPIYEYLGFSRGLISTQRSNLGRVPLRKASTWGLPSATTVGFAGVMEAAGAAEVVGGGPEDPAADIVAGGILLAGGVAALKASLSKSGNGDGGDEGGDDECDEQWQAARKICAEMLSAPKHLRRETARLRGGYDNIEDCARGFVSEDCGGNPVDYGPQFK